MVYTPPVAPGDTGLATHVLRTLQGMGKTTVIVDAFNDNNIIINTSSDDTTTIPYDTPVGATLSVPPGSFLKTFLDLLAIYTYQHQLANPTPPPAGPNDSYAVINQPFVTVNTATNPDTKSLNLRYIHSNNPRLYVSNTPDSVELNLDLPRHKTWYWSMFGTDFDLNIGPGFKESTGVRWQVEIDTSTVNNGSEDGWKIITVDGFDLDGSYIDETKIQFVASVRDDAFGCERPHHIEVGQDTGALNVWIVRTRQWDGSNWVPHNTRFYLRLFLVDQPFS